MDALTHQLMTFIKEAKPPVIIAIDGACASGKSTAAKLLANTLGANLFHMDDFYLPFELRSPERMKSPGGNVHYERLLSDVLTPAQNQQAIAYRRYCSVNHSYSEGVDYPARAVTFIEGTYALHPSLAPFYSLKLFFTHAPRTQLSRIEKRNGSKKRAEFELRWIPLENQYFDWLSPDLNADLIIDTTSWF